MFRKSSPQFELDLNADIGEGNQHDEAVMKHLTSVNIACGGHAGDRATMRESLRLCAMYGLLAGAHPSLPDRASFGYRPLDLDPHNVRGLVREQIEELRTLARAVGSEITHVKLHGALYAAAVSQPPTARAVALATADAQVGRIYVPAGSPCALQHEALALGLSVIPEGYADLPYGADGRPTLHERNTSLNHDQALAQGVALATRSKIQVASGQTLPLKVKALSFQSERPNAPRFALALASALRQAGTKLNAYVP